MAYPHSRGMRRACGLACVAALTAGAALAQGSDALIGLINAYRHQAQTCEGRRMAAAGPLAPDARLATVKVEAGRDLLDALKARGYQAAQAHAIAVSGPDSAGAAMNFMRGRPGLTGTGGVRVAVQPTPLRQHHESRFR